MSIFNRGRGNTETPKSSETNHYQDTISSGFNDIERETTSINEDPEVTSLMSQLAKTRDSDERRSLIAKLAKHSKVTSAADRIGEKALRKVIGEKVKEEDQTFSSYWSEQLKAATIIAILSTLIDLYPGVLGTEIIQDIAGTWLVSKIVSSGDAPKPGFFDYGLTTAANVVMTTLEFGTGILSGTIGLAINPGTIFFARKIIEFTIAAGAHMLVGAAKGTKGTFDEMRHSY